VLLFVLNIVSRYTADSYFACRIYICWFSYVCLCNAIYFITASFT